MRRESVALIAAAVVATTAVTSALASAHALRRAALRVSRQQPTAELWFEPATPTSPELVSRGRKLFVANCLHCHGVDARGDEGPDLHALEVSDRYIAHQVATGIKGEMPSFAKKLKRDDTVALTAYLRTLE